MVPVIKKDGEGNEIIVWIDYNSINGWGLEGHRTTCITSEGIFYWPKDLEDFEKLDGCIRCDRSAVVKIDKVNRYDKELRTLHFHETNHDPYVTVSRGKKTKVEEMLRRKGRAD